MTKHIKNHLFNATTARLIFLGLTFASYLDNNWEAAFIAFSSFLSVPLVRFWL